MESKTVILAASLALTGSFALAQSSGSSAGGSSSGTSATGSARAAGSSLSNGSTTINGTGGSPGPNTFNALNHGTTGNNLGRNRTNSSSAPSAAVDTPAANSAVKSLGTTDTGILRK